MLSLWVCSGTCGRDVNGQVASFLVITHSCAPNARANSEVEDAEGLLHALNYFAAL